MLGFGRYNAAEIDSVSSPVPNYIHVGVNMQTPVFGHRGRSAGQCGALPGECHGRKRPSESNVCAPLQPEVQPAMPPLVPLHHHHLLHATVPPSTDDQCINRGAMYLGSRLHAGDYACMHFRIAHNNSKLTETASSLKQIGEGKIIAEFGSNVAWLVLTTC
jgi:hypothetical protein